MLKIKLLRLSRGLTQWTASKSIGVSQGRYSMIERGLIEPTEAERERLARGRNAPGSTLIPSLSD